MIDFNEMTEFVRPVHEHIKDLFILDIEAFCDFADNLKYHIPDSLSESGYDRAVAAIEEMLLPAYKVQSGDDYTRVFMFPMKALKDMTKEEKVIACYQHACLLYENNLNLTNQAVRERFGLDKNKSSVASRIIADTVERGLLKVSDEQNTSTKYVSYIPFYG